MLVNKQNTLTYVLVCYDYSNVLFYIFYEGKNKKLQIILPEAIFLLLFE